MNKTIQKKLITECIRGWFILDNMMFNGSADECLKENKAVLNEYNQLKKTFLKTVFEYYNKIGYKSSFNVLPRTSKELEKSANVVTESLKKDLSKQFIMHEKKYCKMIAEGINYNDDKLLEKRTNYLGRSLMIENHFIKNPTKTCYGSNLSIQELNIYKNCLTECINSMLKIAYKYNKKF